MSEARNKILDKAKKLKELALRGVDGEMANAKVMLDGYMLKHKISEEELENHSPSYSPSSPLSRMTDEEFINEIIKEFVPIALGVLFSRFGSPQMKSQYNAEINGFANKFLYEIVDRANKKANKQNQSTSKSRR